MDLSVCIITKNEEKRLPLCLSSLPSGCEIIVIDDHSLDQTREIAKKFNAKVISRKFDDFATQKNFAIENSTRTWVFSIDADEEISPELSKEIVRLVKENQSDVAYRVTRRLSFLGKDLRFGKSRDQVLRLFRKIDGKFQYSIHESIALRQGVVIKELCGFLKHTSYEDLQDYFERFNRYTTLIAKRKVEEGRIPHGVVISLLRMKWEFFKRYIILLGFMDGYHGFLYALLSSFYMFVKYEKHRELANGKFQ